MLLIQVLLIQVSTIIIFDNLYVQNQSTTTAQALARTKTRMTTWLNSNFRGRWKEVSGPNVTLASNQWMIVMRIGKQGGNYDYHYWYADPGYATVYKVTDHVLAELLGRTPSLYTPPRTQFITEKGDVVDAPLIKAPGKAGGPHRK